MTSHFHYSFSLCSNSHGFDNPHNGQGMLFSANFRPTTSPAEAVDVANSGKNDAAAFPGGYLPPPRSGWKWWRYREMSDKEILDHLADKEHYDFRELPPSPSNSFTTFIDVNSVEGDLVLTAPCKN